MWLGASRRNTAKPLGIAWPVNSILALGIYFLYNDEIRKSSELEQHFTIKACDKTFLDNIVRF